MTAAPRIATGAQEEIKTEARGPEELRSSDRTKKVGRKKPTLQHHTLHNPDSKYQE